MFRNGASEIVDKAVHVPRLAARTMNGRTGAAASKRGGRSISQILISRVGLDRLNRRFRREL